jgi:hypothetical protein
MPSRNARLTRNGRRSARHRPAGEGSHRSPGEGQESGASGRALLIARAAPRRVEHDPRGPGEGGQQRHRPLGRIVLRPLTRVHLPCCRAFAETMADGAHLSDPPGTREWLNAHCGFQIRAADVTVPTEPAGNALQTVPHPDDSRRIRGGGLHLPQGDLDLSNVMPITWCLDCYSLQ